MDTLLASSSPCPRTKAEPVKLSLATVGTKRLEEMEDVLSIAPLPASTVRVCTLRNDALEHGMNLRWARGSMLTTFTGYFRRVFQHPYPYPPFHLTQSPP